MSRLRLTLISASMLIALGVLTLSSLAQQPQGRNGGGPGAFGKGGRGPGGFFGGPGGRGAFGSLLNLASNPGVQEELKLKQKQKDQIKSLSDRVNEQMRQIGAQYGFGFGGRGGGPNGNNGPGGGQAQVQGGNPGGGGGGGGNPNNPGFGQNLGGFGRGGPPDPERQQRRQMWEEAQNELRQTAEQSLGKILDRNQVTRIKQIQLQLQGPSAIVERPDMIEKLFLDETQVARIQELIGEHRQAQGENRRNRFQAMQLAMGNDPNAPGGFFGPGGRNRGNRRGGGNAGNGANGNNADGNDANGGNTNQGANRPPFDPAAFQKAQEAFRKAMQKPEVQEKMEEFRAADQKLENQFMAAVNQVLNSRQRATYRKMLGPPFDRSKMGGPPWLRPGSNGPSQATAQSPRAAASKSNSEDDEDTPTAKPATPQPKASGSTSARPKRRSLRESRGVPPSNPDQ